MLNNFIYKKIRQSFEESLNNNEVPEDAIGFIEDTKEIWNHGTYFGGSSIPTKITYSELKTLRDNYELSEGHIYRIIDYMTTTIQSNTKSAKHPFDILVLAVSANELSHIARAIQHEGDTYFDGNDLGAWELWYDLDNDTDKYEWADATNGKGVIYRMIDEKRNDCPYDFKNILFYNDKITGSTTTDKYYFTFSYVVSGVLYDGTVEKQVDNCYGNEMGVYISSKHKRLNRNVFRNTYFGSSCYFNTFGDYCYLNTFDSVCYFNTFGDYCYLNTFGSSCNHNTFGHRCYLNTLDYQCMYNTLGNNCESNEFNSSCNHNTLGNNCYNNTFDYQCMYNTLGNNCKSRHIDSDKTSITCNDEYYDDGSSQLVPIKHPDLSTQPSILPYKFMGQYVYEQLIVTYISSTSNSGDVNISWPPSLDKDKIYLDIKAVLTYQNGVSIAVPIMIYHQNIIRIHGANIYDLDKDSPVYLHVVYTSMPEESSYYGYNNY